MFDELAAPQPLKHALLAREPPKGTIGSLKDWPRRKGMKITGSCGSACDGPRPGPSVLDELIGRHASFRRKACKLTPVDLGDTTKGCIKLVGKRTNCVFVQRRERCLGLLGRGFEDIFLHFVHG